LIITVDTPTTPKEAAQLHPFVQCYKPAGVATYKLLDVKSRRYERRLAHDAGEWRHPAVGEDDKAMDVIIHQHQTHRSWHGDYCNLCDKHLYTR
jgi:hypothetical protein